MTYLGVAKAGDPGLDFDVTTVIKCVLVHESADMLDVVIEAEGGIGGWAHSGSSEIADVDGVTSVSMTVGFGLGDDRYDAALRQNVEQLRKWGEEHAIVRIVMALRHITTIYGPDGTMALLPRSDHAQSA